MTCITIIPGEQTDLKDIEVELAEYRSALRKGQILRALACLNAANEIGRRIAEKRTALRT